MLRKLFQSPRKVFSLSKSGTSFKEGLARRFQIDDLAKVRDPTKKMWLDFALSSVDRGRNAMRMVSSFAPIKGKKVLDVGCAYGGFLIAAQEAGASNVVGIDISTDLLELAGMQLSDHHCSGSLFHGDILDSNLVDELGTFDVIFCNDVIEHVKDPNLCFRHLAKLLNPSGVLFMEIPNATSLDFMLSDGHYGIFGLTLLDRFKAERLWQGTYQNDIYGVEFYAPLGFYVAQLSSVNMAAHLINRIDSRQLDELLPDFDKKITELEEKLGNFSDPDAAISAEVTSRGLFEVNRYRQMRRSYENTSIQAEKEILGTELYFNYGLTFWTLIGRAMG